MSNIKLVREKETFRSETLVDVDGSEVKLYVKSSVNYERLTFKVQPVLTLVHEFGEEVQEALVEACAAARAECMARLDKYRSEVGVGRQLGLDFSDSDSDSDDEPLRAAA